MPPTLHRTGAPPRTKKGAPRYPPQQRTGKRAGPGMAHRFAARAARASSCPLVPAPQTHTHTHTSRARSGPLGERGRRLGARPERGARRPARPARAARARAVARFFLPCHQVTNDRQIAPAAASSPAADAYSRGRGQNVGRVSTQRLGALHRNIELTARRIGTATSRERSARCGRAVRSGRGRAIGTRKARAVTSRCANPSRAGVGLPRSCSKTPSNRQSVSVSNHASAARAMRYTYRWEAACRGAGRALVPRTGIEGCSSV